MRYQGRITQWKDEQGYGFITPNGGGDAIFLHIKALKGRQPRPSGNEIVSYEVRPDGKGRLRAEAVTFVCGTGRRNTLSADRPGHWPGVLTALFILVLLAATLTGKLPMPLLAFYAGASVIAFLSYGMDKAAAREGRQRTPESTLHLLSLIGGWPGALLAQRHLRHKSSKTSFLIVFWFTVLLNCCALGLLLSPRISHGWRLALGTA